MDEIALEEDVYEGRLFGWRWFAIAHGPNSLVAPMQTVKREFFIDEVRDEIFESCSDWTEAFPRFVNVYELFDWNESDEPPRLSWDSMHGFWVFTKYRDCINGYAETILRRCHNDSLVLSCEGLTHPGHWPTVETNPHSQSNEKTFNIPFTPVVGFVELSGTIVEHEAGYRAERLRLISLYSLGSRHERLEIADAIGWPDEIKKIRRFLNHKDPTSSNLRRLGI